MGTTILSISECNKSSSIKPILGIAVYIILEEKVFLALTVNILSFMMMIQPCNKNTVDNMNMN